MTYFLAKTLVRAKLAAHELGIANGSWRRIETFDELEAATSGVLFVVDFVALRQSTVDLWAAKGLRGSP